MFNIYEKNYRPNLFRRLINSVDTTVSTVIESIVVTSENVARSIVDVRLLQNPHYEDITDINEMFEKRPVDIKTFNIYDHDIDYEFEPFPDDSNKLGRLADSIFVIVTEYRIRIRKVRRTGENQFKILEQSMLHNCEYLQNYLSQQTEDIVIDMKNNLDNAKIEIALTTEDKINEINGWLSSFSNSISDGFNNFSTDFKNSIPNVREYVDDFVEASNEFSVYIQEELVVDTHEIVDSTHLTVDSLNSRVRSGFEHTFGILDNPEIKAERKRLKREMMILHDDPKYLYMKRGRWFRAGHRVRDEKDLIDDISSEEGEPYDDYDYAWVEPEVSSEEEEPEEDADYGIIRVEANDERFQIQEDPDEGLVDEFLKGEFDFAPSLQTDFVDFEKPFVMSKYHKAVYEYKYNPSLYNAYILASTLPDEGFQPVFVKVKPVRTEDINDDLHYFDLRSDQHNSGKLTRLCKDIDTYEVTTAQLSRGWKPLMLLSLLREATRVIASRNPNEQFDLHNVIEERVVKHELKVSPELLYHTMSPKTMNLSSTAEKAQLNLDLAARTNSSVNLPYTLAYGSNPLRENTASLAFLLRESLAWKQHGCAGNFCL